MSSPKANAKPRTRSTKKEAAKSAPPGISPEDYAAFIGQIELRSIWLQAARVENYHGPHTPEQAIFRLDSHARWELQSTGFRVLHTHKVDVEATDAQLAILEVTFGLDFDSRAPMSDAIFAIFEEVNLPVNTWPFLREFVSTTVGRMGWLPFTLPALKQGVHGTARPARATGRTSPSHRRRQSAEQADS
jgi:hypothetical protein